MTYDEFKAVTIPLAIQLGAEWDAPTWRLYHRAVENIPLALYATAIAKAAETRTKMPSASQLRELAEAERQALIAAHRYNPEECEQCNHTGWVNVEVDGILRVQRCICWKMHLDKLARLGVGTQPLALPAARESEWSPISE